MQSISLLDPDVYMPSEKKGLSKEVEGPVTALTKLQYLSYHPQQSLLQKREKNEIVSDFQNVTTPLLR